MSLTVESLPELPGLSNAERERLALLLEEMAEASQVITKILRHGFDNHHPDDPSITNRMALEFELGDTLAALDIAIASGDVEVAKLETAKNSKLSRVGKYLHFNKVTFDKSK